MSGTVAIGNALTGATVTVIDANGKTATATSGAGGAYSVSLSGLTAPFVITASAPSGVSTTLYSVVASSATSNGAPLTVNVTPLTTAVAALLAGDGNPVSLTQSGGVSSTVTPSAVTAAVAKLDAALSTILTANGLSSSSFDPIGGTFTPNQSGADAVIDSVSVTPSVSGTGLQLTSLADPNTPIALNQNTAVSTPLTTPTQTANYLSALVASLGQCMSDVQGGSTASASTACASALDANYLNNGFTNIGQRHTLFVNGTTLQGVKTVAFLPAGTLPAIANPAALVYFLITQPNGTQNFASDIVQKLPNGNWDIIGNQAQFAAYVASYVGRVQYVDSADANKGRYESGLTIQIPTFVTLNNAGYSVGSALVQGPGLPASGVYMTGAASGFGPYLTFPQSSLSAPPVLQQTSPSWVNVGMSDQYKWSWQALSGGGSVSVPSTPDYASAPANVSAIQQFGVYTVTFYNYSGAQIGTPQKVLNIAPNTTAATGTTVPWPTLGTDVVASLLTPGGSGASTATATAASFANIDWSVPSTSLSYPNTWVQINSQGAGVFTNGVQTFQSQPYDIMNGNAPKISGTTYSSTVANYVDQLTSATNALAETSAQVQIGWQADGEYYTSTWQYNN
ncbi:carboxypeptidase regulatory-like domain-containing protein [Trinickia dinghuensis]|uniref:Carboxypeptidase regulatory-like domain-containing protein n=2 Tax=Trinickia dinghuensis TaxID=2291023 RepID=A0A3D8JR04_9BURK|nr:carboxypeptidase regulatory-like domain-containing protein [Trinickia dinghuensis]